MRFDEDSMSLEESIIFAKIFRTLYELLNL